MRVIALLSLLFGFMGIQLLDGQVFTHAVMGIVFSAVAIGCGLGSAHRDHTKPACLWEGRIMALLGLILLIACVTDLPAKYHFQRKFNERSQRYRELHQQESKDSRTQP